MNITGAEEETVPLSAASEAAVSEAEVSAEAVSEVAWEAAVEPAPDSNIIHHLINKKTWKKQVLSSWQ